MEFVMLARIGFVAFTLLCGVSVGKEFLSSKSDTRYLSVRYVDEGEKTKVLAEHALQLGNNGTSRLAAKRSHLMTNQRSASAHISQGI
jgi:hypothetical protein